MLNPSESGGKWLLIIFVIVVTLLAIVGALTLLTLLVVWMCANSPGTCVF